MPVQIQCPQCRRGYQVDEKVIGQRVKCKACGQVFAAQGSGQPAQPKSAAAVEQPASATSGPSLLDLLDESLGSTAPPSVTLPAPGRSGRMFSQSPKRLRLGKRPKLSFGLREILAVAAAITAIFSGGLSVYHGVFLAAIINCAIGLLIARKGMEPEWCTPQDFFRGSVICVALYAIVMLVWSSINLQSALAQMPAASRAGVSAGAGVALFAVAIAVASLFEIAIFWLFSRLAYVIGFYWWAAPLYVALSGVLPLALLLHNSQYSVDWASDWEPPTFPVRGALKEIEPGVQFTTVRLGVPEGAPGQNATLYVYEPSGEHGQHSLPCILIAPAGSNLITGMRLGDNDRVEHLPYVKSGFAVVAYELDGDLTTRPTAVDAQVLAAYGKFAQARAGLVNARNAYDFVIHSMSEIDPERIYAAGHSSAATLALLVAEHDARIKGCIAYAPVSDVMERLGPLVVAQLPYGLEFVTNSSPKTREDSLGCPVFLFHAKNDSNVPARETTDFADRLRALHKKVTLATTSKGDHYDSMISSGIPMGIEWLRRLDPKTAAQTTDVAQAAETDAETNKKLRVN